jgi:hypothetical protein
LTLPDGFTIASAPADGAEAIACLGAYYAELAERFDEGFDVSATTSSDAPWASALSSCSRIGRGPR